MWCFNILMNAAVSVKYTDSVDMPVLFIHVAVKLDLLHHFLFTFSALEKKTGVSGKLKHA